MDYVIRYLKQHENWLKNQRPLTPAGVKERDRSLFEIGYLIKKMEDANAESRVEEMA